MTRGKNGNEALLPSRLLGDVRSLIESARERTASAVNSQLVGLYWQMGARIRTEILKGKRADYGEQVVELLAERLTREYGRGFSAVALLRAVRLVEAFPDSKILSTLSTELGWSHFQELLCLKDPLQRDFYAEMCRLERWSVRALRERIRSMLFERTALSRKPTELMRRELDHVRQENQLTPDLVFRDPYVLDFMGLQDATSEKDLEAAILGDLERFMLALGGDFAFVARQKRMPIGGRDFYLDLLFFHRGLRSPFAVELKLGAFSAEHKGKMELYLRWLARHEKRPGEGEPLGLILCAEADEAQVELLELDRGSIRVAKYVPALPEPELLRAHLRETVRRERERLGSRGPAEAEDSTEKIVLSVEGRKKAATLVVQAPEPALCKLLAKRKR